MIVLISDSIQLSDNHPWRVQLHPHNVTGLANQFIESTGICVPQPAAPACNRLIKNSKHCLADDSKNLSHLFSCLCHIELQVILLVPHDRGVHHSPLLHLITITDASNHCRAIRKLLKMQVSVQ